MKAIRIVLIVGVLAGLMLPSAAFAQSAAADLFKAKCAMCHGPDGAKSMPGMGVKPINTPEVAKMSDADLATAISNGKGKMPAFKGKLTDDQIKSLAAYVKTLKK